MISFCLSGQFVSGMSDLSKWIACYLRLIADIKISHKV